jgi:hypothetical protein
MSAFAPTHCHAGRIFAAGFGGDPNGLTVALGVALGGKRLIYKADLAFLTV